MMLYIAAAWVGALLTFAVLSPTCGALIATALTPFGGSAAALCVAVLVYLQRTPTSSATASGGPAARRGWSLVR
jgi:hypothetical protein